MKIEKKNISILFVLLMLSAIPQSFAVSSSANQDQQLIEDERRANALITGAKRFGRKKNFDRAMGMYRKALALAKNSGTKVEAYKGVAYIYRKQGNPRQSVAVLEKALRESDKNVSVLIDLGLSHRLLMEYEKAIFYLEKARLFDAENPKVHFNLGNVYIHMDKKKDAIAAYLSAIEYKTDYHKAYLNLANVYNELEDYDSAIKYYREASLIESNDPRVYMNMGTAYLKQSNFKSALHYYDMAKRTATRIGEHSFAKSMEKLIKDAKVEIKKRQDSYLSK